MNECLAENYTFMNVMGALAGLGIPIKEALRGFCNKIVTRLKTHFRVSKCVYCLIPTDISYLQSERFVFASDGCIPKISRLDTVHNNIA